MAKSHQPNRTLEKVQAVIDRGGIARRLFDIYNRKSAHHSTWGDTGKGGEASKQAVQEKLDRQWLQGEKGHQG